MSAAPLAVAADPAKLDARRIEAPGRENLDLVILPNAFIASGRVAAAHVQAACG
jgi:hypothetical protein